MSGPWILRGYKTLADAELADAAPEMLRVLKAVAEHFEDTDAPLGHLVQDTVDEATGGAA